MGSGNGRRLSGCTQSTVAASKELGTIVAPSCNTAKPLYALVEEKGLAFHYVVPHSQTDGDESQNSRTPIKKIM
jgi:hypothetical protein